MIDLFGGLEDRHYFLCLKITDSQDQVSFCCIEPGRVYIDKDGNTQVDGWISSLYAKEDDDFLDHHFQYLMKVLTIDDFQQEMIKLDRQSA